MRRSLPSLQRLRALEAVLHLGGFSAAAAIPERPPRQSTSNNAITILNDFILIAPPLIGYPPAL